MEDAEGDLEENLQEQEREPRPLHAGHPGGSRTLREGLSQRISA